MFVFSRVTGEPVWPIEERAVPPSKIPGEKLLTRDLFFLAESGTITGSAGNASFRAYDKRIGRVVWETQLPTLVTGAPMTYMHKNQNSESAQTRETPSHGAPSRRQCGAPSTNPARRCLGTAQSGLPRQQ